MDGRNNVEIRNGTIREFGNAGIFEINILNGSNHRVMNVRVIQNGAEGINLFGIGHVIQNCAAYNNGTGICVSIGGRFEGNIATDNMAGLLQEEPLL